MSPVEERLMMYAVDGATVDNGIESAFIYATDGIFIVRYRLDRTNKYGACRIVHLSLPRGTDSRKG